MVGFGALRRPFVPQGQMILARQFIAGSNGTKELRPEGTPDNGPPIYRGGTRRNEFLSPVETKTT